VSRSIGAAQKNLQYGKITKDTKTETKEGFLVSAFVVSAAFTYCDGRGAARFRKAALVSR